MNMNIFNIENLSIIHAINLGIAKVFSKLDEEGYFIVRNLWYVHVLHVYVCLINLQVHYTVKTIFWNENTFLISQTKQQPFLTDSSYYTFHVQTYLRVTAMS